MNDHQRILKAYKTALYLYPKDFKDRYAGQMLLVAEDALQDTASHRAVVRVAGGLAIDLAATIVRENSKCLRYTIIEKAKKVRRQPARSLMFLAFQSIGIGLITYILFAYALFNFNALRRVNMGSFWGDNGWAWGTEVITVITPLLFVPIAFTVLYTMTSFSLWRKITWSYGLALLGMVGYQLVVFIANWLSIQYMQQHHGWGWLIGLLFLGGYYGVLRKIYSGRRWVRVA